MIEFLQQLINGLSLGAIYALIALGYTMVYGVLRFINFAHGDVFMIGAFAGLYVAPLVMKPFGGGPSWTGAFVVLIVAMLVCAILGIIIEKLAYRPLRNRPRLTVLITAIGVSLFLENFGQYAFGVDPQSFPDLIGDHAITIPAWCGPLTDLTIMVSQVLVFGVTIFLLIALRFIVTKTKLGMAMRALSVNPVATSLMGVNNDIVISFTFALGSALAAVAGIFYAMRAPGIEPLMGVQPGLRAFIAAVLGGIGNLQGAVLGGIVLGLLETFFGGMPGLSNYRDGIAFAILILILLFKPAGLLGKVQTEKV